MLEYPSMAEYGILDICLGFCKNLTPADNQQETYSNMPMKKIYDPNLPGYDCEQRLADGLGIMKEEVDIGFATGKFGKIQVEYAIASLREGERDEIRAFLAIMHRVGGYNVGR